MANLIGKGMVTDNKGIVDSSGFWVVTVKLLETAFYDDGTEEREVIEAQCMDRDFDTAHQIALQSAVMQLREEVYDRNHTSLIEARKAAKELGNDSKANEDTATQ